jgi:hypothetical protein
VHMRWGWKTAAVSAGRAGAHHSLLHQLCLGPSVSCKGQITEEEVMQERDQWGGLMGRRHVKCLPGAQAAAPTDALQLQLSLTLPHGSPPLQPV